MQSWPFPSKLMTPWRGIREMQLLQLSQSVDPRPPARHTSGANFRTESMSFVRESRLWGVTYLPTVFDMCVFGWGTEGQSVGIHQGL